MAVTLKLMQPLSGMAGSEQLTVDLKGDTLGDLIGQLSREHGQALAKELLDESGQLDQSYAVSIDGTVVRSLSARVRPGAEVLIFASLAGGSVFLRITR